MSLTAEVNTEVRTGSRVAEFESHLQTRGLEKSDWWFSERLPVDDFTSSVMKSVHQGLETEFSAALRPAQPIRKDTIGIKLGRDRKVLLQQWECLVLEQVDSVVKCELHDLTDESNPAEYAEVYAEQFNTYDVPFLVEGAVFYWSVGYLRKSNGQIRNVSEFIVRRIPKLTRSKRSEITSKVAKIRGLFKGK